MEGDDEDVNGEVVDSEELEGEEQEEEEEEEERLSLGVLSGRLGSQVLLVLIGVLLGLALSQPERFSVAFIARGEDVDEMLPPSPPRTVPFHEDWEGEEAGEDEEDEESNAAWLRQEGWEQHFDPTNGKPFFHHAASKVSQWERPTRPARSAAAEAEAGGADELPSGWRSAPKFFRCTIFSTSHMKHLVESPSLKSTPYSPKSENKERGV